MTPRQKRLKRRSDNQAIDRAAGVKRPKLPSRKTLVRELDAELSRQVCSEKTMCAFCPSPSTQNFHFLTRKNFSTRWDRSNCTASCGSCNIKYEHDANFVHFVVERYRQTYGQEKWDALVRQHHTPAKFSRTDLAALLEQLKAQGVGA